MWIGRIEKARVTYGSNEIALVPACPIIPTKSISGFGCRAKNADPAELKSRFLASAMDGVVDVRFAVPMSKLGGLAVLNLEGVQTRYKESAGGFAKGCRYRQSEVTSLLQRIYQEPVHPDLMQAGETNKDEGGIAAVSSIPSVRRVRPIAQEAGAMFTLSKHGLSTARHISTEYKSLDLTDFAPHAHPGHRRQHRRLRCHVWKL